VEHFVKAYRASMQIVVPVVFLELIFFAIYGKASSCDPVSISSYESSKVWMLLKVLFYVVGVFPNGRVAAVI